jgi:hypothetical protein
MTGKISEVHRARNLKEEKGIFFGRLFNLQRGSLLDAEGDSSKYDELTSILNITVKIWEAVFLGALEYQNTQVVKIKYAARFLRKPVSGSFTNGQFRYKMMIFKRGLI